MHKTLLQKRRDGGAVLSLFNLTRKRGKNYEAATIGKHSAA